jgi:hypothetical protein
MLMAPSMQYSGDRAPDLLILNGSEPRCRTKLPASLPWPRVYSAWIQLASSSWLIVSSRSTTDPGPSGAASPELPSKARDRLPQHTGGGKRPGATPRKKPPRDAPHSPLSKALSRNGSQPDAGNPAWVLGPWRVQNDTTPAEPATTARSRVIMMSWGPAHELLRRRATPPPGHNGRRDTAGGWNHLARGGFPCTRREPA